MCVGRMCSYDLSEERCDRLGLISIICLIGCHPVQSLEDGRQDSLIAGIILSQTQQPSN